MEIRVSEVSIYPNPVQEVLNVDLVDGNYEVTVMSSQGRILDQMGTTDRATFNFSNYQSGVYFLLIKNTHNNMEELKKLVKL